MLNNNPMEQLNRTLAPAAFALRAPVLPHIQTATLNNGIPLHMVRFGTQPVLELQLVFRAGHAYEAHAGLDGITLRMLNEGTHNLNAQQLAEKLEYLGAFFNVSSGYEISTLTLSALTRQLPAALPLLQEVWLNAGFPAQEFEQLRTRELQSLAVETQKTTYHARKHFLQGLYGAGHPYGTVATAEQYAAYSPEVLRKYFKQTYTAGNCALIAAGQFEPDLLIRNLNQHIGVIQPVAFSGTSSATAQPLKFAAGREDIKLPTTTSVQSSIRVGHTATPRNHPDYHTMRLVTTVLGGYFGSRLMQNIREDKGYTYGIHAQWTCLKHAGHFVIGTDVGNEYVEDTLTQIRLEINRLQQELMTAEELELARNHLLGQLISEQETPFQIADLFKNVWANGLPMDDITEAFEAIQQVTPTQVQQLAQRHLNTNTLLEVIAGA